jgi:hypothetical protein
MRILLSFLFLVYSFGAAAKPICVADTKLNLSSSGLDAYKFVCADKGATLYCREKSRGDCLPVNLKRSAETWNKALGKAKNAREKRVFTRLKNSKDSRSLLLAVFTDELKLKKPFATGEGFRLQTGKYSRMTLNTGSLRTNCLTDILASAYVLQKEFPQYSFELQGKIKKCANLRAGIKEMVKNKSRVVTNLKHIISPLHTVYLTSVTKFNNDTLGEMGLYVNVNKNQEIKKRLVDFALSRDLRR